MRSYIVCVILIFLVVSCRLFPSQAGNETAVTVSFINVGQGLAVLMRDNSGHVLLYDAGPSRSDTALIACLDSLTIDTIDACVLSHAHEDHYGGMFALMKKITVKRVYWRNKDPFNATNMLLSSFFRDSVHVEQHELSQGDSISVLENCAIGCLWPENDFNYHGADSVNAESIVLRMVYGKSTLLLSGDINAQAESVLVVKNGSALESQLLQASHHGSKNGNSIRYVSTVSPLFFIASCGAGNSYGHPAAEALSRAAAMGCPVRRTDEQGTISFTTNKWEWK